jgi:hypothetical protein
MRVRWRADRRPAGVDLRPRRQADPQGQARQAQRVRVRHADLRGDRAHQARRARADLPATSQIGNRTRTRCSPTRRASWSASACARASSRWTAGSGRAHPPRWRTSTPERTFIAGSQRPGSRRTQRRLLAIAPARRQAQPPQTRLWAAPQPAEGPPRPAHLDRLGDPRLQPGHARRPDRLKHCQGSNLHRELRSIEMAAPPPRRGRFTPHRLSGEVINARGWRRAGATAERPSPPRRASGR